MPKLQDRLADLIAAISADIKALTNAKANKSETVALTGDQTVNGVKTFTSPPAVLPIPTLSSNSQLAHKKYVDDLFASVSGGGGGTTVPVNYVPAADRDVLNIGFSRRQTYIVPKEELLNYSTGATDATKKAALDNNLAKAKSALQTYPNRLIEFDMSTGEFWPMAFTADERDTTAWPTSLAWRLKGRFKQVCGTFPTQASYDDYVNNNNNPNGYIPAKPVFELIRAWGTPQDVSSISTATFGPGSPVPWYMQTQQATKINLTTGGNVTSWEQGDAAVICSNDYYLYSARAGYSNNVWHAQKVNVADIGMDVSNYTIAAASTASVNAGGPPLIPNGGTSANGMEGRIVRGASSNVTALVRGDTGASQLLFTKLTTAFTVGETLVDDATGQNIGTVGSLYLVISGKLTNSFTTTPCIRKVRRDLPVIMDIEVMLDVEPSSKISKWNRCPEVALTGTYDHNVKVNIKSGSQRGLTITSCFKGRMEVKGGKLPNHAMEQVDPKEEAYGYGAVVLGCAEDLDVVLDVEDVRHGFSSNVLGGKWNLNSSGNSGTHAQSLNYHKYGTSRDIRVSGRIYYTFGACIDTHEGMDKLLVHNFKVGKSFWAGRNLSMGAGINTRGSNTIIRDGVIEEVKVGIFDSSQSTPIGESGFRSDTYIKDVIVLRAQAGGYMTNDDVATGQAITVARTFIDGCVFEGDLDIPTSIYTQAGIIMNRGYVITRDVTIRKQNSAMIIHKGTNSGDTPPVNGGVGVHIGPVFDFTEGTANAAIRYETHMTTTAVIDYTILANGASRPASIFRHIAAAPTAAQISAGVKVTNVQWSGHRLVQMSTTAATPVQNQNDTVSGTASAGTMTYLSDPGNFMIPTGGTTGQVLKKTSGTDGDLSWGDAAGGSGLPVGGSTGQFLRKASTTDGDAAWNWPAQYSNVNVDGVKQLSVDIDSTPPIKTIVVTADQSGPASAAANPPVHVDCSYLQTSLTPGTYEIKALVMASMSAAGALRVGLGGPGSPGGSITNVNVEQANNTTGRNYSTLNVLATAGTTSVTAATGVTNATAMGNSPGSTGMIYSFIIEGILTVTSTGTFGLSWMLSPSAAGTATLKAGSFIKFTRTS